MSLTGQKKLRYMCYFSPSPPLVQMLTIIEAHPITHAPNSAEMFPLIVKTSCADWCRFLADMQQRFVCGVSVQPVINIRHPPQCNKADNARLPQ